MRYLPREDAPFGEKIWKLIDGAVIGGAKSQLAGRRLLDIEGPLGLGLRSVDQKEEPAGAEATHGEARAEMSAVRTTPIPLLHAGFTLSVRDVAAVEEQGMLIELGAAAGAGIACARLEDELVFQGNKRLGIEGLLTAGQASKVQLGDWSKLGQPVDDLIKAVNALDGAGFPGPYAAALAPDLYNALFRRYGEGNMTQLEHARQLITAGLGKAAAVGSGGVVIAAGRRFASIVLGQDMTTAYVGPSGASYEFVVMESLCPRITMPEAVCVLRAGK